MARRRLVAPDAEAVQRLRSEAAQHVRDRLPPPVAQVAADAAIAHGRAFDDALADAQELARARSDGRLVHVLSLEAVEAGHLSRDRVAIGAEDLEALKASIRMHGLRGPIEVTPLPAAEGRYGLVSGWRRLLALRELWAETGDATFASVKAIVRPPSSARAAYVAMVEENEIRADLSFYERGRIAVVAAELGVFESTDDAIDALFAAGSAARRSKIRAFARIHEGLGDGLAFPAALGERLGLRLAAGLKRVPPGEIAAGLAAAGPFDDAAAEQAALSHLLDRLEATTVAAPEAKPGRGRPRKGVEDTPTSPPLVVQLRPGIRLEQHHRPDGVELRLSGPELTPALVDAATVALQRAMAGDDPDGRS